MIHLGTLNQQQLSEVLQRIENGQKTGVIVINKDNIREEIYLYQGQVVTIISARPCEPLVRRLVHADMISVNDLQKVPTNMGKMISQAQEFSQYSDTQVATILMQLGLISQKQLATWVKQETVEALQQLLIGTGHEIYFEENVQPPADCLYLLLTASTPESTLLPQSVLYDDGIVEEGHQNPVTPLPMLFKKSEPVTDTKQFVPITPSSGFAQLPRVFFTTQDRIQRTVAAVFPQPFADDGLTVKVAIPSTTNPLFKWETLLIIAVLLIAGLAHGINMFHFPYFENDEGTYMSQAWSVIYEGRLAPYTYWYDHAPVGWLQIAIWAILTGSFHTFGPIINSGRVLMLLIQLGSTLMLYYIARNISRSIILATLVVLLFALSPYGIYYHRRVLLDNIMTFWMLLSVLPLTTKNVSLKKVWLSAVALGISILSKEVTIFIVPVMMYLVFFRSHKSHRWYAIMGWIIVVSLTVSLYLLYAVLKNELFPSGTLLGGAAPHVSLIGTLQYQASRGKDGGLFDIHSGFWYMISNWIHDDPLLLIVGSLGALISVFAIRRKRLIGIMGLITLSLWAFLARGGEIIGFYLVPLLPFLALNIGLTVELIFDFLKKFMGSNKSTNILIQSLRLITILACLVGIIGGYSSPNVGFQQNHFLLWNGNQTANQNQAISWVQTHISPKSVIVVDDSSWTDLYDTGTGISFKNVQWYWKVDLDPAIRLNVFHNNWRNIDYMVVSGQMVHDAQASNLTLVETALEHSTVIVRFNTGTWPIEIRKVNK